MAATLRELRGRIRSAGSIKKITKAQELIATSRIAKAQARVEAARPYATEITNMLTNLAGASALDHPLLVERENPKRAGVLVVSSDRGLCGAYNANALRQAEELLALLRDLPVTLVDCGVLPDALQPTQEALLAAAAHCDVVVTSAGVSVGDYDFLTQAITAIGQIEHYKVALKPGKPFVFGCIHQPERPVLYVGLPGNPLSTFLGAWLVLRPMLWQLAGQAPLSPPLVLQARLTQPIAKRPGRREFQRARLTCAADGWTVTPFAAQDSHRVLGLAEANALIDLPEACAGVAAGDWVAVRPLGWGFDL